MTPYGKGYTTPPALAPAVPANAGGESTAEPVEAAKVSIAQMRFDAPTVTITVGRTVTWTNTDGVAHTITSNDGSFGSEELSQGGTFSQIFNEPGTYSYHCQLHPTMRGTVVVVG